ncbi:sugar kinase [Rhodobacteraceae bacterium N5(2021)]|uniref:Sugar kinase n=1 Tax=Gymnodinialimonas phycosphaerae TaxID=2841589 RepID=A0A975TYQ9_9RHOB|nr:sugar kinase [Gymnodinialimonas phycosphaerae]MBY4892443.1 sugar kinase [Gymnodinialimonas phycosphaerae]
MTRVVSIGECMVEMAPAGAAATYGMSFAGDTFNTAWYLARLAPGWQVDFLTAVGTDSISDSFMSFAAEAGIGTRHMMRRADRGLGLYLIELTDGERAFHYWRDTSAARTLADEEELLTQSLQGADIVFFSGITLAILSEEGREVLFDAISEAQAGGAVVAFDPNIRPRLWSDEDEMRGAIMEAALSSDIVLPSYDEEAHHFGDADPKDTVARYLSAGATSVVVKNGGGDVHFSCGGEAGVFTPSPVEKLVDTTAAGDSFNAGFLAHLIAGNSADEAVAAACAVSGQVIQARGALVDSIA